MTTSPDETPTATDLHASAAAHLWPHFSGLHDVGDMPIIVRGEGCRVWDAEGNEYLDGLAGLFVSQLGHGRQDLVDAAARQGAQLAYFPIWGYGNPPAIELSERLATAAPGDLGRVFLTSGGSEAVESAWKLVRQYFRLLGQPDRYKVIARHLSYHGTTFGALAISGLTPYRDPFEPMAPGAIHVANTNRFRPAFAGVDLADDEAFSAAAAGAIEDAIVNEGPSTVAAVYLEPVQNAGGCIPPPRGYFQRVREICDRHGVLLVSDEVICAFGRLGELFGCDRYGYQPDLITLAKGITSGYAPLGAVLVSERVAEPFSSPGAAFTHGLTFGGHPVACAVAMANLDGLARDDVFANVRRHEPVLQAALEELEELPLVGDVRGAGYFWAIELVSDPDSLARFEPDDAARLARALSRELAGAGLLCRVINRGDLVVQLSPPLIAGPDEIDRIASTLHSVLGGARV